MAIEVRGSWAADATKIMGHHFAEEAERMRSMHKSQELETLHNGSVHLGKEYCGGGRTSFFQITGFSAPKTVTTDCEKTSNFGSDSGTPVGYSVPFHMLSMSANERACCVQSVESCRKFNSDFKISSDDDTEHGSLEDDMKELNEDMEIPLGRDGEGMQSKQCPRGHWRPAEDDKLRELVSQFGPQNWNLIAEKLQGRSGNVSLHPPVLCRFKK